MNRKSDDFEKLKIAKASTDKVVTNIYFDAFGIEKVRLQNANYQTKESISCYIDFENIALLAADVASGRLIKNLEAGQKTISLGGSKSSDHYNGAPEFRSVILGRSGDTIFINMSRGKGKITSTGAIAPDGKTDLKISVPMSIDKFRSMILYTHDAVNAYLAHMINQLVREYESDRRSNSNNK